VQREDEARAVCEAILKADPNNAQARETLGEMEFRAQHIEEARRWFGEAVRLDPKNSLADYYYAWVSIQSGHLDDASIETSLRAAIQSNPAFAPAYERLASYLGMKHEKLDEAFTLIKTAIKLDPGNFYFRMNAGSVLMSMQRFNDAAAVYAAAVKLAKNPAQAAEAQAQVNQVHEFLQRRDSIEQEQKEQASQPGVVQVVEVADTPRHPAEANGPKHTVSGTIQNVTCGYPSILELEVDAAGKTVKLYNNDFTKIELTAIGFTPNTMNPCNDLKGYKAKLQYAESTDKTVDGQVFAIELHK
jgi:predicted Zn-dependent protease